MRIAGILIALLVLAGCGGGDDSPVTTDTTPPTIVATSPADAADDVAVDDAITATFSEDMNPSTIATSTFLVSDGVFGSVSYGSKTATLTPSQDLEDNFLYTARLTTAVKDEAGNALSADYSWSFTTEGDAIIPLRIDNYWTAQNTSYNAQGNEYASNETTRLIVRDTIISSERWYIDQSEDLYINQADGLHR
ncbi:MAG: Ig-like domain-containing protein, partial [FCB group bacterium]|nr:Ig-like domain-containing protein [FCB group bacterium]